MDRIAGIRAFVEVAERRSFAEAARRLRRSPTAVTRVIADLEARLGTRLLNRTTRSVSLTEAGERFLAGARRVLADLEEIERAAAGEGSAPRGELRLTAPILFGRLHVLPIVTEFLSRFPAVSVTLSLLDRPVWWKRGSMWRCALACCRKARPLQAASARCAGSWLRLRIISLSTARRQRRRILPGTLLLRSPALPGSNNGLFTVPPERATLPSIRGSW